MSKKYFFFYGGERDEMPEVEPIPINREIIEQEGTVRERVMRQIGEFYDYAIQMALVPDGNTFTRATERAIDPVQPRDATDFGRTRAIAWYGAMAFGSIINDLARCVFVDGEGYDFAVPGDPRSRVKDQSRESRFDTLRAEGKKLGEINAILEAEGYAEVFGEGVMPAPTKSHQIVRENKGAKQMIGELHG